MRNQRRKIEYSTNFAENKYSPKSSNFASSGTVAFFISEISPFGFFDASGGGIKSFHHLTTDALMKFVFLLVFAALTAGRRCLGGEGWQWVIRSTSNADQSTSYRCNLVWCNSDDDDVGRREEVPPVLKFVPRDLEWQCHMVRQMATQGPRMAAHSALVFEILAPPFKVPGDKNQAGRLDG